MADERIYEGVVQQIKSIINDLSGNPFDPVTVTIHVRLPNDTTVPLAATRESTGVYVTNYAFPEAGPAWVDTEGFNGLGARVAFSQVKAQVYTRRAQ